MKNGTSNPLTQVLKRGAARKTMRHEPRKFSGAIAWSYLDTQTHISGFVALLLVLLCEMIRKPTS